MKNTARKTMFVLALILNLALPLGNSARGKAFVFKAATALATDTSPNSLSATPIGLNVGFAMADFTGDTHPDLATVELSGFDSGTAEYMIEVQLTEGGHQTLQLSAPFGGILVTPKDVTGEGNLDLVISSARSHTPVALFVNDGHGHFSAADTTVFAKSVRDSVPENEFSTEQFCFSATVVSPKPYAAAFRSGSARSFREPNDSLSFADYDAPSRFFSPFGLNRAPPAVA
jgi:hypothetical protein